MSLSSFFRDYVYIPLGGNRVNKLKWIRNILIVWSLTGLWHGAEWNFVIWGIYFAIILLIEKLFLQKTLNKLPKIVGWLYAFILINIGWIIFRAESIELLTYIFKNIFILDTSTLYDFLAANYNLVNYFIFIILGFVLSFPIYRKIDVKLEKNNFYLFFKDIFLILILIFCICTLISNSYNPFIYFRF